MRTYKIELAVHLLICLSLVLSPQSPASPGPRQTTPTNDAAPVTPDKTVSTTQTNTEVERDTTTELRPQQTETPGVQGIHTNSKNLSFLLDPAIYHAIPQDEIPKPLRRPLPTPPLSQSNESLIARIDALLADGDFAGTAHFAALCLTSPFLRPTDTVLIFELLSVRYTCLELLGQKNLAAREAKALEDLTSTFYYDAVEVNEKTIEAHAGQQPLPVHAVPFELRVQATRLQSIAFDDRRRFITALYELGFECRDHIASLYTSSEDRKIWSTRLSSLGLQVVNSLIDFGEFDCAERLISEQLLENNSQEPIWVCRKMLLLMKMGRVAEAEKEINKIQDPTEKLVMQAILATAADDLDRANALLTRAVEDAGESTLTAVTKQSLAINCLYRGRIGDAQEILEGLVAQGSASRSSITILATIFELRSDKSQAQKQLLAEQIAASSQAKKVFSNSDLKL